MRQIKISVRTLVEFIYREGDIDSTMNSGVTMQEGTRIHQLVQSQYVGYKKEVALKETVAVDEATELLLTGRADGIKDDPSGVVIDEIKSTFEDLDRIDEDYSFLHWAQAKLYGAIYARQKDLEGLVVQLTYYSLKSESAKSIPVYMRREELVAFFDRTIDLYRRWVSLSGQLLERGETSAKAIKFPFGEFRSGQDVLAKAVYTSIRDGNNLIAEAPTGIGKTMASLFPAIKAYGEGHTQRIFYLTSKTLHRKVALDAVAALEAGGLSLLSVGLMAKEKMCINDMYSCKPEFCPYAKGHYDRVNDALYDAIVDGGLYDPQAITKVALDAVVCPFELALDMTDFAQVVVCDYNYFLDPFVQLKRHFMEPSNYTILIDEAHNLYERARDMYTAPLSVYGVSEAIDASKDMDKGYCGLLKKVRTALKKNLQEEDEAGMIPSVQIGLLNAIAKAMLYFLDQGRFSDVCKDEACVNHFFEMHRFTKLVEFEDDHFIYMQAEESKDVLLLRCLDPSKLLADNYKMVRSVICFSATLSPFSFYQAVLGHEGSKRLQVGSPFDVANRILLVNTAHSTLQKDRDQSMGPIAIDVSKLICSRIGNYFVFCPSYAYIEQIGPILETLLGDAILMCQRANMRDEEREEFLHAFEKEPVKTTVGLVVLGGAFSEGVDLQGERLTGVVVIGVGMPVLSKERMLMRDYYTSQGENGFDYAFTYPGLNKVFQAGGRLIRTETDCGVLMLVCRRFGESRYLDEFPRHWRPYQLVRSPQSLQMAVAEVTTFFGERKKM